jgi:hypothetical protein
MRNTEQALVNSCGVLMSLWLCVIMGNRVSGSLDCVSGSSNCVSGSLCGFHVEPIIRAGQSRACAHAVHSRDFVEGLFDCRGQCLMGCFGRG